MTNALLPNILLILSLPQACIKSLAGEKIYEPSWESLDARPIPGWYDKAKIGIFLHWGVYSVPSLYDEWFWYRWKNKEEPCVSLMEKVYPPKFSYQEFAKQFTAEFFNASEWVKLFKNSGAEYVVLTSKHHDGFTLWPSTYAFSWNAVEVGPKRDLIGELAHAVREANLTYGVYYSLMEWYHPLYKRDKSTGFTTNEFVTNKMLPELFELVQKYTPQLLWTDGEWEAKDSYWNSTTFLAWLYNESPVKDSVITNDRWGDGVRFVHGGVRVGNDRFNPGSIKSYKFENAMTMDKNSWGYRRNAFLTEIITIHELIKLMIETVSYGGNILINVGPTHDGRIDLIYQERLLELGKWLEINHESIKYTRPWTRQRDHLNQYVWYTQNEEAIYAITVEWPKNNTLLMGSTYDLFANGISNVTLLGDENNTLKWKLSDNVIVQFPDKAKVKNEWAWVLKLPKPNIDSGAAPCKNLPYATLVTVISLIS